MVVVVKEKVPDISSKMAYSRENNDNVCGMGWMLLMLFLNNFRFGRLLTVLDTTVITMMGRPQWRDAAPIVAWCWRKINCIRGTGEQTWAGILFGGRSVCANQTRMTHPTSAPSDMRLSQLTHIPITLVGSWWCHRTHVHNRNKETASHQNRSWF